MRIGMLTTRLSTVIQYITRDIAQGFADAGCEVSVLVDYENGILLTPEDEINWFIDERPDIIFCVDATRNCYGNLFPENVPWVCYHMDRLQKLLTPVTRDNDWNFFMFDLLCEEAVQRGYRKDRCFTIHPAANMEIFNLDAPKTADKRFKSTVSFVCHYNSLMKNQRTVLRTAAAEIAQHMDLALFGSGWDKHPTLASHARGLVENGEELKACYQGATVHLHANEDTHHHQRVYECLASGGNIACFHPGKIPSDVSDYLWPWMHVYHDEPSLRYLVKSIKLHDSSELRQARSDWVRRNHRWKHRCEAMLNLMEMNHAN